MCHEKHSSTVIDGGSIHGCILWNFARFSILESSSIKEQSSPRTDVAVAQGNVSSSLVRKVEVHISRMAPIPTGIISDFFRETVVAYACKVHVSVCLISILTTIQRDTGKTLSI